MLHDAIWHGEEAQAALARLESLTLKTIERSKTIATSGSPADKVKMITFAAEMLNGVLERFDLDPAMRDRVRTVTNPRLSELRPDVQAIDLAMKRTIASLERVRVLVSALRKR
jgi:hypothetical protein